MTGHLDYIRTVQFHHEQPWIISCSDDQTIRIWNWQSRSCITVLTGHNHYVMSAFFHPKEDLVVSSSLDQTVRVWDISGLKKKSPTQEEKLSQLNQDLFGSNDVLVKYVLEGHERGVNWAYFHPTLQLIVSGGDDRVIKLWRYNENRAWEMDTFRGHVNNVSCCMFHPKFDMVISNSEDKSIRVWDYNKNSFLYSFKRESDRFWVLVVHPTQNLIAAGHDNGVMVFKFERERPAFFGLKTNFYFIKDKFIKKYDFDKNTEQTLGVIKKSSSKPIKTLSINENEMIITSENDGGDWEMLKLNSKESEYCPIIKKGNGITAIFSGRKMVYLDKNRNIQIDNPKTNQFKQIIPSSLQVPLVDNIFPAQNGRILLKTEEKLYLYDFEENRIISEMNANGIRYVIWSDDLQKVALLSKHSIILSNNKLETLCTVHEISRIKSGCFDENGIFIYSTLNHMKYLISSGDFGTIKTLENPIYIVKVKSNAVHYLDREGNMNLTYIDATEYKFKLSLIEGKHRNVKQIMSKSKILGESIISYLHQKGHPEIALKFVQDENTKFNLALECGNIKNALNLAHKLKNNQAWIKLGNEALQQGDFEIVEKSYQRTNSYEKLSFLYLINGDIQNLEMMQKIAGMRKDVMSIFQNALFLGDVEERIEVLQKVGHLQLAYITAKIHGIEKKAKELQLLIGDNNLPPLPENPILIQPPTPIYKSSNLNWPLLTKQEEITFDDDDDEKEIKNEEIPLDNKWGEEIKIEQDEEDEEEIKKEEIMDIGTGWSTGLIDMPIESLKSSEGLDTNPGKNPIDIWTDSEFAVDHIASGSFKTAMNILTKTLGITNFKPLKMNFMNIWMGSQGLLPSCPSLTTISLPLISHQDLNIPQIATPSFEELTNKLKSANKEITDGKFTEAQNGFLSILHSCLFLIVSTKKEVQEVKEMIKVCCDYLIGIKLELSKRESKDIKKSLELAAYFTHSKLSQAHVMLSLFSAMGLHFKNENFISAAAFAKRLKKLSPPQNFAQQADYVIKMSDQKQTNKYPQLNYDEKNPFNVCCLSLTPIYLGSDHINCPFCGAYYLPKYKDELCVICNVATIGKSCSGMNNLRKK